MYVYRFDLLVSVSVGKPHCKGYKAPSSTTCFLVRDIYMYVDIILDMRSQFRDLFSKYFYIST